MDMLARERHRGVLACGNFALTAVLLQKFAEAATRRLGRIAGATVEQPTKFDLVVKLQTAQMLGFNIRNRFSFGLPA